MKIKPSTFIIGILLITAFVLLKQFHITDQLQIVTDRIEQFGMWAPVIFVIFYIFTAGYILPVVLLTMMSGFLFGVLMGSIVASTAFTLSSAIVYCLGYYHGRKLISQRVQSSLKFQAIARALKEDGLKLVFMLRFVPILSSIILNMACGLIRIKFQDFILGTFFGQLPGTILYVYSGFIAKDFLSSTDQPRSAGEWALLGSGILMTAMVITIVTIKSNKALKELEKGQTNPSSV
ncbi:MAG: TVP38/TMEM64 family protein [Candidatus Omnitrophica bacterium]|nr:TVP38/TMEM64 family protein [Candidatus Omnitrophota bacterium]